MGQLPPGFDDDAVDEVACGTTTLKHPKDRKPTGPQYVDIRKFLEPVIPKMQGTNWKVNSSDDDWLVGYDAQASRVWRRPVAKPKALLEFATEWVHDEHRDEWQLMQARFVDGMLVDVPMVTIADYKARNAGNEQNRLPKLREKVVRKPVEQQVDNEKVFFVGTHVDLGHRIRVLYVQDRGKTRATGLISLRVKEVGGKERQRCQLSLKSVPSEAVGVKAMVAVAKDFAKSIITYENMFETRDKYLSEMKANTGDGCVADASTDIAATGADEQNAGDTDINATEVAGHAGDTDIKATEVAGHDADDDELSPTARAKLLADFENDSLT